jgi:hypothetical protein
MIKEKKLDWTDYLEFVWFGFLIICIYFVLTSPPAKCPQAESTALSLVVAATCMYGKTGIAVFTGFIILTILAVIFVFKGPKKSSK